MGNFATTINILRSLILLSLNKLANKHIITIRSNAITVLGLVTCVMIVLQHRSVLSYAATWPLSNVNVNLSNMSHVHNSFEVSVSFVEFS